ncbi:ATP-binding cassette domain-containing protein [Ruminiclostridium papyrosolvens]|uniref:ATP-binding cassette domain-containing protein n=1 Tax=Ruminiclostridium papyrosolvens TaxID=29362 RepID=UPI000425C794|nr:ATP-binding cassette domain-containing protein [Ruminiclostridium papyrosolvens]
MALYVDIKKRLGKFNLDVQFSSQQGIMSLLGSSGSGKSMILKCIAGIETPDEGRIVLNHRVLFDSEKKIKSASSKTKSWISVSELCTFS